MQVFTLYTINTNVTIFGNQQQSFEQDIIFNENIIPLHILSSYY